MSARRPAYDEVEATLRKPVDAGTSGLSLWDQPTPQSRERAAREETEKGRARAASSLASHGPVGAQLVQLARSIAKAEGEITVARLREEAVKEGLLTGRETGRELSWLGAVMPAAGLRNTGQYVRSHIPGSNGNLHARWAWPEGER